MIGNPFFTNQYPKELVSRAEKDLFFICLDPDSLGLLRYYPSLLLWFNQGDHISENSSATVLKYSLGT